MMMPMWSYPEDDLSSSSSLFIYLLSLYLFSSSYPFLSLPLVAFIIFIIISYHKQM